MFVLLNCNTGEGLFLLKLSSLELGTTWLVRPHHCHCLPLPTTTAAVAALLCCPCCWHWRYCGSDKTWNPGYLPCAGCLNLLTSLLRALTRLTFPEDWDQRLLLQVIVTFFVFGYFVSKCVSFGFTVFLLFVLP